MKPLENEVSINIDQTYGQSLGIKVIEKFEILDGQKRFLVDTILLGGLASGRTDIKIGDEVLSVNDFSLTNATLNEATDLLNSHDYSMISLLIKPEPLSNKNDESSNSGSTINCSSSDLQNDPADDVLDFFPPLPSSLPPPSQVDDGGDELEPLPPPPSLFFNVDQSAIVFSEDDGRGEEDKESDDNDDFPLPPPLEMLSPKTPALTTLPSFKTNYNATSNESYLNQSENTNEKLITSDSVTSSKSNMTSNYFNFLSSSSKGFSSFASKLNASGGSSVNDNSVTEKRKITSVDENCDSRNNISEFNNSVINKQEYSKFNNTVIVNSTLATENDSVSTNYTDSETFSPIEVIKTPAEINIQLDEVFINERKSTLNESQAIQLCEPFFNKNSEEDSESNSNAIRNSFFVAKEILTKNETVSSVLKDYYVEADVSEKEQERQAKVKKLGMAQALLPKNMRGITDLQATVLGSGGMGRNTALGELQDFINSGKNVKEVLSTPETWTGVTKLKKEITDTPSICYKEKENETVQSDLLLQQNETIGIGIQKKRAVLSFGKSRTESWNVSEESQPNIDLHKPAKTATPPVREKSFAKVPKVVGFSEDQIKQMIENKKVKSAQQKHSMLRSRASVSEKCSVSYMESQLEAEVFKKETQLINNESTCKNEEKDFVDVKKKIQDSRKLFEAMSSNKIENVPQDSRLTRSKSAVSSLTKQPQYEKVHKKPVINQDLKNLKTSKDNLEENTHTQGMFAFKNETKNDLVQVKSTISCVEIESVQPIYEKKAFYELMNKTKHKTPRPLPKKASSFSVKASLSEEDSSSKISSYRHKLKSTGRLKDLTKQNVLHSTAGAGIGDNIIEEIVAVKEANDKNTYQQITPVEALKSKFETPTKKMPLSPSSRTRSVDETNGYYPSMQEDVKLPGKSIASLISDSPKNSLWKSFLQNYSQK